ncbi:alpha/beta-hydrolase [Hortaea werneckii]|nr:alpha/beta-hydrolase [Hortaea werneckii]
MSLDKIKPNDPRVQSQFAQLNGRRWHYLDARPQGEVKGTCILIHGFPDLSLAWKYQIPMLLNQGLRCLALDCMGYGSTGFSPDLKDYTFQTHADAIAELARQQGTPQIILGGHDWGGAVVYRVAQFYPELVSHVFSVATPFFPVTPEYRSVEELVKGGLDVFGYQLQWGSLEYPVEKCLGRDEGRIRRFLNGAYGGKPESGRPFMSPQQGVDLGLVEKEEVGKTPLLDDEEIDFYVQQFTKNGFEGPCNWYRTRRLNWEQDQNIPAATRNHLPQPVLFIQAKYDGILIPKLSQGMEKAIPNLTRAEVPASHWALWHTPELTNETIQKWIEGVVLGGKAKL